ncbi:MAG: acetyl-CoA acetyltransferase, acetyl-CoA C-acetyltransferase [Candidatus Dadabacteria bacterium CSP1-2]|jgi:acetyl-CoA C-acetyltransferase|nr:MAG: acetyl-CoA acetyltransferase, acetyl-CoA C-acetyltransferase [Candidatus Dadabacteria bacterium CSP1-2]
MKRVSVIGIGNTRYGVIKDRSFLDLAVEAGKKAMADAGITTDEVEAFYLGNYAGSDFINQNHLAPYVGAALRLRRDIPCTHIENACASGGSAVREGILAIGSGTAGKVLVIGIEKMNTVPTPKVTEFLAKAGDWEHEVKVGYTFPSAFAMMARRHMHQYGTTREHLAAVTVKNHTNALKNPDAQMQKLVSMEQILNDNRVVADPLRLYDCSLITDGASAVILADKGTARNLSRKPVDIIGFAQANDSFALYQKDDLTRFDATVEAANMAFQMAGVKREDVDVAEVHDCFTIAEIIAIEDLGFVPKGEGGPATLDGLTSLNGKFAVNPSGGLKAKGHPVGATGVGQIVEIVEQLRGEAGDRQVKDAEIGLTHNLGGSGATCVVHILARC